MSATNKGIIGREFIQQSQNTVNDDRKRRVLLAKALIDNNNTNISCRAINSEIVYSDVAVFRIQSVVMIGIVPTLVYTVGKY